jgi:tetratricopeptide (TPR) repeat protein
LRPLIAASAAIATTAPRRRVRHLAVLPQFSRRSSVYPAEGCSAPPLPLKPDFRRVYGLRGFIDIKKGLYEGAIADLSKALALKPDYAKAYNNRAWVYHLTGEDAKGLPDADKAVALAPKEANCVDTRAAIDERLGQRDATIAAYSAALLLDPQHQSAPEGLRRLGALP